MISTHAPLAGRDEEELTFRKSSLLFQPTRPLRGATAAQVRANRNGVISTHAPLAGRDAGLLRLLPDETISTHAPLAGRD